MEKRIDYCSKTVSGDHIWIVAAIPEVKLYGDDVWKPAMAHIKKCAACGLMDDLKG